MKEIGVIIVLIGWLASVVLAKAGWLKLLAIFMPFYAWYLVAERLVQSAGWV